MTITGAMAQEPRQFTVSMETVNCLGSCAIAPVMVINDQYYGRVTTAAVGKILEDLEAKE